MLDIIVVLNSVQVIAFSETERSSSEIATGTAEEALPWHRRRRGSVVGDMAMAKMGCQGVKEAMGGRGVAGKALWRRGDDGWRPAVEKKEAMAHG